MFVFSDPDLINEFGLMSPMSMLRYARLSLFARISFKVPAVVCGLLDVMWDLDVGWLNGVRSDLAWFSFSGLFEAPPGDVKGVFGSVSGRDGGMFVKKVRAYSASKFANFDVPVAVQDLAPPPNFLTL